MSEELKKVDGMVELEDEDLDLVAGGYYTPEEWAAMTIEEQRAAQERSMRARISGTPCELDV